MIHREEANSTAQCQDACTNFDGCNFYSYDPATEECFMFDDCPALDDNSCPDCVSGSPGCDIEVEEGKLKLLYTGLGLRMGHTGWKSLTSC